MPVEQISCTGTGVSRRSGIEDALGETTILAYRYEPGDNEARYKVRDSGSALNN